MKELFPELFDRLEAAPAPTKRDRKKADTLALKSPFMHVPHMRVEVARALLDIGLRQLYELRGRAPEALLDQMRARHPDCDARTLALVRLAVYCAETPEAERLPERLHPSVWA